MEWRAFWCLRRGGERKIISVRPGDPWHKVKPEEKEEKRIIFCADFRVAVVVVGKAAVAQKRDLGPNSSSSAEKGVIKCCLSLSCVPPSPHQIGTLGLHNHPFSPSPRPIIAPLPPSPPTPPSNPTWQAQAPGSTPIKRAELWRRGKVGRTRRKTFFS